MTDDSLRGRISFDGTATPTKTALFLIVCFAWLVPGLVGHDPWKADEAVSFGQPEQAGDQERFHLKYPSIVKIAR